MTKKFDDSEFSNIHDFREYLKRKHEFSLVTFGSGLRTKGIVAHIKKELEEILEKPTDLEEWIDVASLALDGYLRAGGESFSLVPDLFKKLRKNMQREWPTEVGEDAPVEHIRTAKEQELKKKHLDEVNIPFLVRNLNLYIESGLVSDELLQDIKKSIFDHEKTKEEKDR